VIEAKVIASTISSFVIGAAIAWLNAAEQDPHLLGNVPVWAQTLLIAVIPAVVTFLAGYQAAHSPRPDLPTPER
jgi:hypothetical protein